MVSDLDKRNVYIDILTKFTDPDFYDDNQELFDDLRAAIEYEGNFVDFKRYFNEFLDGEICGSAKRVTVYAGIPYSSDVVAYEYICILREFFDSN